MKKTFDPWYWKIGKPADIWVVCNKFIGQMVNQLELKPMEAVHTISASDVSSMIGQKVTVGMFKKGGAKLPGGGLSGIIAPHLHFNDKVYLLSDAQWKTFSRTFIQNQAERLQKVGSVDIQSLHTLSQIGR